MHLIMAGVLEFRGRVRDEDDGQVVQHHRGAHDEHQGDHLPTSLCGRNQSSECRQPRVHIMKVRGDAHACTYAVMHMSAQSREHVCINCLAEHPRVHELSDIYVEVPMNSLHWLLVFVPRREHRSIRSKVSHRVGQRLACPDVGGIYEAVLGPQPRSHSGPLQMGPLACGPTCPPHRACISCGAFLIGTLSI